ncbi:hypothetical protein D3C76_965260 [compost metagenome]
MREVLQHIDAEDLFAHRISQIDAEAEHHIGDGQAVAGDIRAELAVALEGGNTCQQLGLGLVLDGLVYLGTKESFGEAGAGRQLDVQLDFLGQFMHLGLGENPFRQQRLTRLGPLDVIEDQVGFTEKTVLGLQRRHLAARAFLQCFGALAAEKRHFFKRYTLFQQRQLDHVVVVADGKSIKLKHENSLQAVKGLAGLL